MGYFYQIINWEFLGLILEKKDMICDWEWGLILAPHQVNTVQAWSACTDHITRFRV